MSLDLSGFSLGYDKARITHGDQVTVTTAAEKYAYAAQIGLPEDLLRAGGGAVEIEALVHPGGQVSFGILSKDGSKFLGQTVVQGRDGGSGALYYVVVPAWDQAGSLVVSNAQERDDVASQVTIHGIWLYFEGNLLKKKANR